MRTTFLLLTAVFSLMLAAATAPNMNELRHARDRQDRAALDRMIALYEQNAKSASTPDANYRLALAYSSAAEVAIEQRDKHKAEQYAESGMEAAQKAVNASPNNAEYHRILGQLCGQVIPANPLFGALKYGQCARDEISKAIELNSKSAMAYVSRGVGNYYLPAQFGGGVELALKDFDKAIALNPKLVDAYLWKGVALRKANRNAEAHAALEKAVQLDPDRVWAKQQLDKTPPH
ncbi:MAG TPA: tetratricopeptide repeat protein [Bryobacteraceae bacterium]|nr:tetratricopeptide repeat protein [Bryobacteraceae bacterium]